MTRRGYAADARAWLARNPWVVLLLGVIGWVGGTVGWILRIVQAPGHYVPWLTDWHVYAAGARDLVDRVLYYHPLLWPTRIPVDKFNMPPFSAEIVLPFWLLPDAVGGTAWVVAGLAGVGAAGYLAARILDWRHAWALAGLLFLAYALHEYAQSHLIGNNTPHLTFMYALFAWLYVSGRFRWAGVVVGLAIGLKIFPVLLLVVPLRERRWQTIGWAVGVSAATGLVALAWLGIGVIGPMIDALTLTVGAGHQTLLGMSAYLHVIPGWPYVVNVAVALVLIALPVRGRVGIGLAVLASACLIPNLWKHYLPMMVFGLVLLTSRDGWPWRPRSRWVMAGALALLLVAIPIVITNLPRTRDLPLIGPFTDPSSLPSADTGSGAHTLLAVGDTGSCGGDADDAVARLADRLGGDVVLLGDLAYPQGSAHQFEQCFDPPWGPLRARLHPAPGNHEYQTDGNASGYFSYFGSSAGEPGQGWYAWDLGAWHLIALNSNCGAVGCDADNAQYQWLQSELAAHPSDCLLAYWHHPRWSSGRHGSTDAVDPLWQLLVSAGVDVVLNGHDHSYERITSDGVREFVVGTGGRSLYALDKPPLSGAAATTEERHAGSSGLLYLSLNDAGYSWSFLPLGDTTYTDTGTGTCSGA